MNSTAAPQQTVAPEIAAADARVVAEILFDYAREITRDDDSPFARMLREAAERVGGSLHSAGWDAAGA